MTAEQPPGPHVVLLATGGTISSRHRTGGQRGAVAADAGGQVLGSVVGPSRHPVRVVDVFRRGSYSLTFDEMVAICVAVAEAFADPQVLGVVVTHGTDTMEETAFLADLTHAEDRPVVFTGAQRPADSPLPDGPGNLARAIAVAGAPQSRGRGALVSFAGQVFPARGVRKVETLRDQAFGNPDVGTAGTVDEAGVVSLGAVHPRLPALPLPVAGNAARADLVAVYPGTDDTLLRAAIGAGAAGIVLQALGSGNANPEVCAAVASASAAGVTVVTSTRVAAGPVAAVYGNGGGRDLLDAGAIPSGILRPSQALVLLRLLLRLGASRDDQARAFRLHGAPPPELSTPPTQPSR